MESHREQLRKITAELIAEAMLNIVVSESVSLRYRIEYRW